MIAVASFSKAACSTFSELMTKTTKTRKIRGRSLHCAPLLLMAALCLAAGTTNSQANQPEAAPLTQEQIAAFEAVPETEQVRMLIMLCKSGKHELAAQLLQQFPLQGLHAANRQLYIEGLILNGRKDYTGAAEKYRAALASDPKLTLVRSDLAKTLVVLEQDESAIHHLKLLAADAPDEQAASGIRSFIDQVDERSPFKTNAYVSLAPSSNVNNGSKHTVVYLPVLGGYQEIADGSRENSGVGLATGFNLGYSKRLGNDFSVVAAFNGEGKIYDDSDYNSYSLSQSVEVRRNFDRGYFGLGMVASESLKSDSFGLSYHSYGPRTSARIALTPQNSISASAVYEWRDVTDNVSSDATALLLQGSLSHAFDSSFNATINAGFDKIKAKSRIISYETYSGGLSLYKELPFGITADVSGQVRWSDFDGVYPLIGLSREDTRLIGTLGLTKRDFNIFGFAPAIEYSYTENLSNIDLFDFNSHAFDFRLTKQF
jgi:outer membrane protein